MKIDSFEFCINVFQSFTKKANIFLNILKHVFQREVADAGNHSKPPFSRRI